MKYTDEELLEIKDACRPTKMTNGIAYRQAGKIPDLVDEILELRNSLEYIREREYQGGMEKDLNI